MKHWACLCGFRAEAESAVTCDECKEPMYAWEPPIVPENWYTIGQVLRRSPEEVATRAKMRRRK